MSKQSDGQLITFEGGEGAGKSTLIEKVADWFSDHGREVVVTFEPGGTLFGEKIRTLLLSKNLSENIDPIAELLLFFADRVQHIHEVIQPALDAGKVVLCDRFHDSTIAYQGGGRELGVQKIESLCYSLCGELTPDITLFLDVDPKVGMERARRSESLGSVAKELDRIESQEMIFHDRVRDAFYELLKNHPRRMCLIDASHSPEEVLSQTTEIIQSRL